MEWLSCSRPRMPTMSIAEFTRFYREGGKRMNFAKIILAVVWAMAAVYICMPTVAGAQGSAIRSADRTGTWDFILPITYSDETTVDGQGGSSADINDTFGFGFGAGYNFNNHFQLGGLLNYNSRSYDATVVRNDGSKIQYGNNLDTWTFAMNGTYYFLDKNFTPFISGSVGYTWVDTNIQNGPPTGYCWWDPWYGYICNSYVPTKTQSSWTYGGGLGVRYDFNQRFSMQGSYNKSWVDIDNTSGSTDIDIWRLDFIFRMF